MNEQNKKPKDSRPARSSSVSRAQEEKRLERSASKKQSRDLAAQRRNTREKKRELSRINSVLKKEPKRKRSENAVGKWFISPLVKTMVYLAVILVISVFLGFYLISVANDLFAFVKSEEEVTLTVPENATIEEVSDLLYENGLIRYPSLFRFYAKLKKDDGKFIAGEYTVKASMNYDLLRNAFKYKYSRTIVRLTIPEGFTCDDIIDLFVSKGVSSREEFIQAINTADFSEFAFVRALDENPNPDRHYRLEGYLYPDTYEFYSDASAAQCLYKLLENFDKKFKDVYYERCQALGLTVDQVITIASYVQSEAYYLDEYERVASVFYNRLNNPAAFPCLESDATAAYAVQLLEGKRPDNVTPETLKVQSPYNTYLHAGLSPGAISNPGYDAIMTALYPASTSYYYFYTNSDRTTVFSATLWEHQAAIAADQNRLPQS
ncbi:MAG: endolytic transglycosylase MltG [Clostridia bacterium]|nr:endolytic transglycosylase MltG [Clostridia bacterium]